MKAKLATTERFGSNQAITKRFDVIRVFVALLLSLAVCIILIFLTSEEPAEAISTFLLAPIESGESFKQVIEVFIPLTFTGLSVTIMFLCNQFNMATEGGFFIGGLGAAIIACKVLLPRGLHPFIAIVFAASLGALICVIPGIFKVRWAANEIVSSLMLNYVVLYIGRYILNYYLLDPSAGYPASTIMPRTAKLGHTPFLFGANSGVFWALLAVVLVWFFLYHMGAGYRLRLTGVNSHFAQYAGIKIGGSIILSQALGGVLAGVGGGIQVLGMYDRFSWVALTGYGFDGIIIAILSRNNPKIIPLAAFFLAYLRVGADIMSRRTDVATEIVSIVQAMIILFVGAKLFLQKLEHRSVVASSKRLMK